MRLPSRVRALVLLSIVLDLPVGARLVRRFTGEPVVEAMEVDGVSVEVVRPRGEGPWPAWLFVNGAHPLRRAEPVVTGLSRGLARAGYLVFVPDVPGLGEGTITDRTLEATCAVTAAAVRRPDVAGGRVALIGASTGAGLALLAAGRTDLAGRITTVAAVAPYGDLERMVCLATTCGYTENGAFAMYEVTDLQRRIIAQSLVATLSDAHERERLLRELRRSEREGTDPVAALADVGGGSAEAQAILGLLRNDDPECFRALYEQLPESVLALIDRLSPLGRCGSVLAPVEVVVPPSDIYFPLGEAHALAAALPNAHLTITGTLDHTRLQLSLGPLRDLYAFDRFVVRGLKAAAG